ncbi:TetR/AcrR family transcriptional regulator C-terminal domain-containing protein [Nocardioides carbamazepini]|uniref:TetR/AcrR family transcriptional regulator n=1 Tax=Nocardioides carbamazepini TaxID=2854259 RepID=UPI002149EF40|nr:TetR/AcrR family transcriptional regulator C-terminal domain-containing protein [Nocardioides carbamazepini]MCR1781164.1 TetR/AcrR family transcriptional regulator C-terminal domain-containing protein [Nocardioides carbamazepini]
MAARTPASRAQLTPDRVVSAALDLTRERGIDGWSLRDLAATLDTWPNTVSYHVGTREQVCQAVVERVVGEMTNPPADLPWQDWFRSFLRDGRDVLLRYRGVARRLCRDGPAVPSAMPIMERGLTRLIDGGFGDDAPRAYSLLLNSALLLVALVDDRVETGQERGDVADRIRGFAPGPDTAPAWALMHGFLNGWASDGERTFTEMFDFTVDCVVAGLEMRLR